MNITLQIKSGIDIPAVYGCKRWNGDKVFGRIVVIGLDGFTIIANKTGTMDSVPIEVKIPREDVIAYAMQNEDWVEIEIEGGEG